jgi:lipopolysaccharide/colanic/teichoic acid biosynthesis glycosyltransferase
MGTHVYTFRPINVRSLPEKGPGAFMDRWKIRRAPVGLDHVFVRPVPVWKRGMDILGAAVGLLLLSPLFFVVALYIKLVSPGPVFFRQQRVSYSGRTFTFWKFRTMHCNADTNCHRDYWRTLIHGDPEKGCEIPMAKQDQNPQIIPYGNILRKSCIDELPQLVNVLFGDMSLVGPRPPIPYEVEEYQTWNTCRFDARPGMTGLWQVSGKNRLTFKEMVRLDIRYSRSFSLWLDLKILFLTPWAIVTQILDGLRSKDAAGVPTTADSKMCG